MHAPSNTAQSTPCRRCHRRCHPTSPGRLCERCERGYQKRKESLPLGFWKVLGFLLVLPLLALTWNTKSPLGDSPMGLLMGHAWLLLLGLFAGEYLSRKLSAARTLFFRYRFEQEEKSTGNPPATKGLYEI